MAKDKPGVGDLSTRIEIIGPERATEILEGNKWKRKVDSRRVARYAAQMAAGHWTFTSESIILNDGNLVDGTHRLRAIVESNVSIPLVVVVTANTFSGLLRAWNALRKNEQIDRRREKLGQF